MTAPRVAVARARRLPDWEKDDVGFLDALTRVGVAGDWCVWDDPGVRWGDYAAVLVRTTWDYQERVAAFRAWLRQVDGVTQLFNSAAMMEWNLDKRYLRDLASDGVPIAETLWVEPGDADVSERVAACGWGRGFAKPVVGATSRATLRFSVDEDGLAALEAHLERHAEPMILQPYLASVEQLGEVSVIVVDGRITHAVRKIPRAGDYRVQDDWGAIDQPLGLFQGEDAFADRVLAALQTRFDEVLGRRPPVVARVDLLRDATNALVLNELELVEPSLFYRHGPGAMDAVARAVKGRLGS